jgi:hypothetical protein
MNFMCLQLLHHASNKGTLRLIVNCLLQQCCSNMLIFIWSVGFFSRRSSMQKLLHGGYKNSKIIILQLKGLLNKVGHNLSRLMSSTQLCKNCNCCALKHQIGKCCGLVLIELVIAVHHYSWIGKCCAFLLMNW